MKKALRGRSIWIVDELKCTTEKIIWNLFYWILAAFVSCSPSPTLQWPFQFNCNTFSCRTIVCEQWWWWWWRSISYILCTQYGNAADCRMKFELERNQCSSPLSQRWRRQMCTNRMCRRIRMHIEWVCMIDESHFYILNSLFIFMYS